MKKILVLSILLSGATAMLAGTLEPVDECQKIGAWIEENRDRLPQSYEEFSSYSADYRRAIFSALPSPVQSELWRTHLVRYQKLDPRLTDLQKGLIHEALEFLRPDFYDSREKSLARVEAFQEKAQKVFGPERFRAAFQVLGFQDVGPGTDPDEINKRECNCSNKADGSQMSRRPALRPRKLRHARCGGMRDSARLALYRTLPVAHGFRRRPE